MNNISKWLSAFRLRTLPLSISGIIVASCMAEYNGVFDIKICVLAILVTLSYQILSNLANDYGDGVKGTDNENRIGPERAIQSGEISKEEMQNAIKLNMLVCIGLTIALINVAFGSKNLLLGFLFLIIGGLSVYAAIKYTVGESAYGYAKQIDHVTILPAIAIGLLSAAVLNLNNMRDISSDKESNKITLAVKLGAKKAKMYHYFLIITAIICALLFGILYYTSMFNLIFLLAFIPLLLHLKKVKSIVNPKDFDPELKKLALSTVLLAILLGIGHLL